MIKKWTYIIPWTRNRSVQIRSGLICSSFCLILIVSTDFCSGPGFIYLYLYLWIIINISCKWNTTLNGILKTSNVSIKCIGHSKTSVLFFLATTHPQHHINIQKLGFIHKSSNIKLRGYIPCIFLQHTSCK